MSTSPIITVKKLKEIFREQFFSSNARGLASSPISSLDLEWADYVLSQSTADTSIQTKSYLYFGSLLASAALNQGHSFLMIDNLKEQFAYLVTQMKMNAKNNQALTPTEENTQRFQSFFIDLFTHLEANVNDFQNALIKEKNCLTLVSEIDSLTLSHSTHITTPLILEDKKRLFLNRHYHYELFLLNTIKVYAQKNSFSQDEVDSFSLDAQKSTLKKILPYFLTKDNNATEKIIFYTAMAKPLMLICGGPGTGKTTIASKLLACFLQIKATKIHFKYALLAPTGKAATRLEESFQASLQYLQALDNKNAQTLSTIKRMPAKTIHRFLLAEKNYLKQYKIANHYDIIIIDEASMLSTSLFAQLLSILDQNTRIILLGDKEQLPSVSSSSLLHDLTEQYQIKSKTSNFVSEMISFYQEINLPLTKEDLTIENIKNSPTTHEHFLCNCIVFLKKIHRFQETNNIHQLSQAVNQQNSEKALNILTPKNNTPTNIYFYSHHPQAQATPSLKQIIKKLLLKHYENFFSHLKQEDNPQKALQLFNQYAILCPTRNGYGSVSHLNALIQHILQEENIISLSKINDHYNGKPIMVLQNDYALNIFNGDIGIFYRNNQSPQPHHYQIIFNQTHPATSSKRIFASQLQNYELAYAITVHKSQGSEYDHVFLILPDHDVPTLLTKELLYTAITRSKKSFTLIGKTSVLENAITRKVCRYSNLGKKLW